MRLIIILLFFLMAFCKNEKSGENSNEKTWQEEYAHEFLKKSLSGEESNFMDEIVIISDKEFAIEYTEKILFKVYGKETIERQKPYVSYLIDGYWVIFGTQHYTEGGVFRIIINSNNGEVINIGHGK